MLAAVLAFAFAAAAIVYVAAVRAVADAIVVDALAQRVEAASGAVVVVDARAAADAAVADMLAMEEERRGHCNCSPGYAK